MCRNPEATRAMGTRAKEAFHVNTPHTPLPLRWNAAAATVECTVEDGWQKGPTPVDLEHVSNIRHSKHILRATLSARDVQRNPPPSF